MIQNNDSVAFFFFFYNVDQLYSGTGNTHIIFLSTFLKNSWSHLYSDSTTGQKSWWNETVFSGNMYNNQSVSTTADQCEEGQMIRNATKSAVSAENDRRLANTNLNVWGHPCTFMGRKVRKAVFEERMIGGDWRFTWIYACWVSTTVILTHGRKDVCIRPWRKVITVEMTLLNTDWEGNLKPSVALSLQGEWESRYATGF